MNSLSKRHNWPELLESGRKNIRLKSLGIPDHNFHPHFASSLDAIHSFNSF